MSNTGQKNPSEGTRVRAFPANRGLLFQYNSLNTLRLLIETAVSIILAHFCLLCSKTRGFAHQMGRLYAPRETQSTG